jgi:glycosyltransferase involved in cell wall biosynthesis|tara:strand:+ start:4543 stop:5763 length:1221 start_codon:yes stop_codon:yes gene_type:complete
MRVYHFAQDLSQIGHNVTVLTTEDGYSSMLSDHSQHAEGVKVVRIRDRFSATKFKTRSGDHRASTKTVFLKKALSAIASALLIPDRDVTWLPSALSSRRLVGDEFDVVLGSYPYATNLVLATLLSKKNNAKLVLDMRDLWIDSLESSQQVRLRVKINKIIQNQIFKRASGIVSVSEVNAGFIGKSVSHLMSKPKICVIRNGFDFSMISRVRYECNDEKKNEKFKMIYAGSFYGGERDPSDVFRVIKKMKDSRAINEQTFEFLIYGAPEEEIKKLINFYKIEDLVAFKGFMPQQTLFCELIKADLLFVITRRSSISAGEMTTKLYEYIGLGPEILCLCQPRYEVEQVLNSIDGAQVVYYDDVNTLEKVLTEKIKIWSNAKYRVKRPLSETYSRECASQELSCFLNTL